MAQEVIEIIIREDGSRVVKRRIEDVGTAAKTAQKDLYLLQTALAGLAGYLAVDKVVQWADAWTAATSKIRMVTKSLDEQREVQERLYKIANDTRQGLVGTNDLYFKLARSGKELSASQEQILALTRGVGQALAIQGTHGQQASGVLLQLGQALGGANIQAQEYNSMVDNLPILLQAVANNMDGAAGSTARLTKMVKTGQVTNKEFFDAAIKGMPEIDKLFKQATPSISQSMVVLDNAFMRFVGELDQAIGGSRTFNQVVTFLADNIKVLGTALLSLAAVVAVAFAPKIVTAFGAAISSVFRLLAANPFGAVIASAGVLLIVLSQFGDAVKIGVDDITTLNDLLIATFNYGVQGLTAFNNALYDMASAIGGAIVDMLNAAGEAISDSNTAWLADYNAFYDGVGTGFAGLLKAVARTLDAMISVTVGSFRAFATLLFNIPQALVAGFKVAFNASMTVIENSVNAIIGAINSVADKVGAPLLDAITIDKADVDFKGWKEIGYEVADSFDQGIGSMAGKIEGTLDSIILAAQARARSRATPGKVDLTAPMGKGAAALEDNSKAAKKLENALESLLGRIDPIAAAQREMADATVVLNSALAAGMITAEQHGRYMGRLADYYRDILDPLGAVNREIEDQIKLLGFGAEQRAIEEEVMQKTNQLRKEGVTLSSEETKALREQITLRNEATRATQIEDQLLSDSVLKRRQALEQMDAMKRLLEEPTSGFTQTDATSALMQQNPDLFAGTNEARQLELAKIQEYYNTVDAMRQKNLISEETATQMKMKLAVMENQTKLEQASTMFGNLATLSKSGNKKIAAIGKAAAVTQATIDGVLAVQKALASAPPPMNYAMAAAVGVSTAANIQQILGVQMFAKGGAFTNGVVSTPTAFNMGMMGEAGPEAIMPLSRTSDGSLGVRVTGGQGSGVVQYVNFDITISGTDASVASSGDATQQTESLREMVVAVCQEWALREQRPDGVL